MNDVAAPGSLNPTPAEALPAGAPNRLREDLIQPDPLLDCLVEVCRLHGQAGIAAVEAHHRAIGHALGQLGVRQAGVSLQFVEDGDIEFVESVHKMAAMRKILSQNSLNTAQNAKTYQRRRHTLLSTLESRP